MKEMEPFQSWPSLPKLEFRFGPGWAGGGRLGNDVSRCEVQFVILCELKNGSGPFIRCIS